MTAPPVLALLARIAEAQCIDDVWALAYLATGVTDWTAFS